ncbi:fibronectin type III domain-containing protein [bacterium]|nr:fibronectin type III domain-containing protein [bacterium]
MGRIAATIKILLLLAYCLYLTSCDGKAEALSTGDYLGAPTIGDGGTRTDGSPSGQLYTVTRIVEATNDIPAWTATDLPFTGPRRALGTSATDSQWPFEFNYTYPIANYELGDARLLVVTARDSSDTEAIFVDGVFTGRPPSSMVSGTSTQIQHRNYSCVGTCSGATAPNGAANTYFMDWALSHYKISTPNTFDIGIIDLLTSTSLTIKNLLDDGVFRVVTGDDAFVQTDTATASKPILIMEGFTVSKTALTCTTSPTYKMLNTYIHNDGNSISQPAFGGTVLTPSVSWSTAYSGMRSVEFFYDPRLPKLSSYDLLNITKADIVVQLRRTNANPVAIVINGIGIDQDGFDRGPATVAVESWSADTDSRTYWNNFINAIPSNNSNQTVTLNLISLLGAAKVKELLLQGKLNIAVAGPIANIFGAGDTTTRTYGVSVNGPDLVLEGNYAAQICEIPVNPDSPLDGGGAVPGDCLLDTASPNISSIQVVNITSNSARVQWLTNESSTSQEGHGITGPTTVSTENTSMVTFHAMDITGLQPYKYYQYNVRSKDSCGNQSVSGTRSFRTLR